MEKIYRHGDLLLINVDKIPVGLQEKQSKNLLEGETSGHIHRLIEGKSKVYELYPQPTLINKYQIGYIQVEETTKITHEEHGIIEIPAGLYGYYVQREYDPIEERRVID